MNQYNKHTDSSINRRQFLQVTSATSAATLTGCLGTATENNNDDNAIPRDELTHDIQQSLDAIEAEQSLFLETVNAAINEDRDASNRQRGTPFDPDSVTVITYPAGSFPNHTESSEDTADGYDFVTEASTTSTGLYGSFENALETDLDVLADVEMAIHTLIERHFLAPAQVAVKDDYFGDAEQIATYRQNRHGVHTVIEDSDGETAQLSVPAEDVDTIDDMIDYNADTYEEARQEAESYLQDYLAEAEITTSFAGNY